MSEHRLQPGQEAKERIEALGEAGILAFFDELPIDAVQRVARHLPRLDGFRPASLSGIARQKVILARKLSRPNAKDRDYHGLYLAWREWIDRTFKKHSAGIQELIDQIEEAAGKAIDEAARESAIESKVDILFATLNGYSRQNFCSREQMERLLAFSPLPNTAAAQRSITSAKTSSDVANDVRFNGLPERFQEVEGHVVDIASQVKALIDRTDQTMRMANQADSEIRSIQAATEQFARDIGQLRAEGQKIVAELGRQNDTVIAGEKAAGARLQAISDRLGDLTTEIDKILSQSPEVTRVKDALASLTSSLSAILERERASEANFENLKSELDQLTRDLITVVDDRTTGEALASFGTRVEALEREVIALPLRVAPTGNATGPRAATPREALHWNSLALGSALQAATVRDVSQIASAFSSTLQSIGIRKQSAEIFAEECASAVIARQAIFLKGAFAAHVGNALALSVAPNEAIHISIPLGLESDQKVRAVADIAFAGTGPDLRSFVIEGIDQVPIEMLRSVIFDLVTGQRGASEKPRVVVFGTLTNSIASIPVEKGLFGLGPLFDLDLLDWRLTYNGDTVISPLALKTEFDKGIWTSLAEAPGDTDEAYRLAKLFASRRDPAIERSIFWAYKALLHVRKQDATTTTLQSLFFGWLLPYWQTLSVPRAQADEELDGGKVNGSVVDGRLNILLAELPEGPTP